MNVAGHRLSTTEIESTLVAHPAVAEAAAAGAPTWTRASSRLLRDAEIRHEPCDELAGELRDWVGTRIGKIARPEAVMFGDDLPKTRSGKIMRRLLKDIAEARSSATRRPSVTRDRRGPEAQGRPGARPYDPSPGLRARPEGVDGMAARSVRARSGRRGRRPMPCGPAALPPPFRPPLRARAERPSERAARALSPAFSPGSLTIVAGPRPAGLREARSGQASLLHEIGATSCDLWAAPRRRAGARPGRTPAEAATTSGSRSSETLRG